jgi:DNA-binding NtrC family response regulator
MEKFIALSPSTKKILKVARMSASLPVNVLITGQTGVGRKLLAFEVSPDAYVFKAKDLEKLLIEKKVNLDEYPVIIVHNIDSVINKQEFINKLNGTRIIATSIDVSDELSSHFAVKLEIPPLDQREEDLEELTLQYIREASKIYSSSIVKEDIRIDLSGNGVTLKQSIFKAILLKSIKKAEMMDVLYDYSYKALQDGADYKKLVELFEIPILNAARAIYKSQLQMAKNLKMNRITLRKKLNKYFGE